MTFLDKLRQETCRLEVTIDVAREDNSPMVNARAPFLQRGETLMRDRSSIEVESVPLEAPGKGRICLERLG